MKNILFIFGTRPEVIKLAPVILELKKKPASYNTILCNTEQQKELSNQTLDFFGLKSDINLDVMTQNQALADVQSAILNKLCDVYDVYTNTYANKIDATIVQGDTMTVFSGALASFYNKVPIFYVESGLRSYDLSEPFPEEAIRQMATRIANAHFAPTAAAKEALLKENVPANKIFVTGNTVIDALFCISEDALAKSKSNLLKQKINLDDKQVLITVHRRENHGQRLHNILAAIKTLARTYIDHQFILPVHPNPKVKNTIYFELNNEKNIVLTLPLDYPDIVCLMKNSKLILTDSGGLQEEAPTYGVPVLVLRYESERKESLAAGFSKLVGADVDLIINEAKRILEKPRNETRLNVLENPYGDGKAARRIEQTFAYIL